MKIPEFSVNRKVTTAMMAMILVVLGFISYTRLGLDFFPELEFPTVSVVTTYSGASPEDIENTITRPLEQVINTVGNVKKVNSITSEGVSVIMVEFEWGTNLDFATQDIREQLSQFRSFLPEEASDPLVVKFNISQFPIIFYGITGNLPTLELKDLIEDEVARRLERIEGVASAQVFSMDEREILVELDPAALEAYKLSVDQIIASLSLENLNLPGGRVVERQTEFLVRTLGEFQSVEDIQEVIVGVTSMGTPIYLRDVGEVRDTLKDFRYRARIQGQKGVFLFVSKRSGANTVLTTNAIKKELAKIRESLPPDIEFYVAMDQADMIQKVINRTANNALVGGILAMIFILVFLRNWRPTVTIFLAIPLSIITTFIAFYLAGYTINLMTLGGLALGIGMLVDNAVVVIENIFRHLEEGADREKAAKKGASEVGMAITASTLTTIAVFFPMVFARGITGQLTRGLALAIAFSLVSSLFVALTVVPMVASLIFKANRNNQINGSPEKKKSKRVHRMREIYRGILLRSLRRRRWVLAGVFGLFVISLLIIPFMGTEFMPPMDRSMLILSVKLPVGSTIEETDRVLHMVEDILAQEPDVQIVTAQAGSQAEDNPTEAAGELNPTGPHEGIIWAGLVDKKNRQLSDLELNEKIRAKLPSLEGVKFEVVDIGQMFMGGARNPVEIKIFGQEIPLLKEIAETIVSRIKDVEGLRDLKHSLSEAKPEYHLRINRDEASRLGIKVSQVAQTIQTAALGRVATRYRSGNEEYDIRVRFKEEFRDNLEDILRIPILTPTGQIIPVGQIARLEPGEGPIKITRENQAREVTVTANIAGRDLGSVIQDIKAQLKDLETQLPRGYFIEYGGQYEEMQDAFIIMAGAFLLAILLVYMIMASQFESFLHPFVIMFTVPLSLIGVIIALLIAGKPVSLPVLIGFVMLAGIAVNNGIVMVDYINQLKRRGVEPAEAILQGCTVRLRPVLITALTTILGMLPMALTTSEGASFRAPMAITVMGGLAATTLLTLFVIPAIYSLVTRVKFR
ncbi:MAG TPA: efflux RND transporter permease subunit [Candidatus Aminicenantes bacterium]|nr:efflux RND transporter permease subunit [Candidatus Aminicenantes bacterium]